MPQLYARLLGGLELYDDNGDELSLAARKARALLAFLIVEQEKWHTRERLADLLWGDRQQAQARHSLTQALGAIRKLGDQLGVVLIETAGNRIRLSSGTVIDDLATFRRATDSNPEVAAEKYKGPLLDGFTPGSQQFEEWAEIERAVLHKQACQVFERAAETKQAAGDLVGAIELMQHLISLDPLRETAHRNLMKLLVANGDRTAAIRQYSVLETLLNKELGVEPAQETRALYQDARASDIGQATNTSSATAPAVMKEEKPPLPDRPSIAVLPFVNLSGDPEQEYFADGMTEDIIAGLSKFRWLFVIARNSSFAYKGKSIDVREVAGDLGVRYVLEGSVRRSGKRIRIAAQLVDAETGNQIWTQRYDRELTDIFSVQDAATAAIVSTIAPEIGQSEIERMRRRPPESLDAWALFQQGMELYPSGTARDFQAAIALFDRARNLDTGFVEALVMAGHMRTRYAGFFNTDDRDTLLKEAGELLQTAMRLDPGDATCHMAMGRWHVVKAEPEIGIEHCQEAVELNPNSVLAHFELAIALHGAKRYEDALTQYNMARRLSPRDLHAAAMSTGPSNALFMLERFEEAAALAARVSRSPNPRYWADALLVAALVKLGRMTEAEEAKQVLLKRKPDFTIREFWLAQSYFMTAEKILPVLREVGLPE
jgi:TolB-like protein